MARSTAAAAAGGRGGPRAWASVGLHPHEASEGVDEVAALLARELAAGDGAVVAVGECGLDYYYEHSPRDAQRRAPSPRRSRWRTRTAWPSSSTPATRGTTCSTCSTRRVCRSAPCCTASPAAWQKSSGACAPGMYISFSGIVTFKNAADVRAAAARCPLDRLLVETDSPFLAPVPHRGRTNEPAYLPLVGAAVAEVKGCRPDDVMERSAAAASLVFSTEGV